MTHETPWRRLTEAAIHYADCGDCDEDFLRARDRLRKAAVAYVLDLGYQLPTKRRRVVVTITTTVQLPLWK